MISAVIVSRMDHPLGEVLLAIQACSEVEEILIVRGKDGVWERWNAAVLLARCPWVYTQDDDAVVDVAAVLANRKDGMVTCNMPQSHRYYPGHVALVGWGCIALRLTIKSALVRYQTATQPHDDIFRREADRVVTGLSPLNIIDVPVVNLPWATGDDRMGKEARHGAEFREILRRIDVIRQS